MHCNGQICDNFLISVNRQYTVHWRAVTANWETGNASEFQLQMASSRLAGFLPAATSVKNRTDSLSIVTKFVRKSLSEKKFLLLIEVVRLHLAFNGLATESHQAQIRWRFSRNTQCLSFHCNQKMNNKQKYFYFASHRWIHRSNPNSQ